MKMPDCPEPSEVTQKAIAAALEAAKVARRHQLASMESASGAADFGVEQKSEFKGDVSTIGDKEGQQILDRLLPKAIDGEPVGFLGEEEVAGRTVPEGAKKRWVVDPIDGTEPYSEKKDPEKAAYWSVSVALQERKHSSLMGWQSTHAVIYCASKEDTADELKGKIFWAELGKGAHVIDLKTGEKRKVSKPENYKKDAEFEKNREPRNATTGPFCLAGAAILRQNDYTFDWKRSICHAAMDMLEGKKGLVLQGTAGPLDWDIAALSLIVPEAGAECDIRPRMKDKKSGHTKYSAIMGWDTPVFKQLVDTSVKIHHDCGESWVR